MVMTINATRRALSNEIMAEPAYTCPKIDAVQQILREVQNTLDSLSDSNMEKIRSANESLRSWGEEWKTKAINIHIESQELAEKVTELEEEKVEYEKTIARLTEQIKEYEARLSEINGQQKAA